MTVHTVRRMPPLWLLWLGVAAGPMTWAAHLTLAYFVVTLQCAESAGETDVVRVALGVVLAALCLGGGAVSLYCYRALHDVEGVPAGRARFMAASGMVLSLLFFAGILLGSLPDLFLRACDASH